MKVCIVILAVILLLSTTYTFAQEVYRWIDEDGRVHFSNIPGSVPKKYWEKGKTRRFPPMENQPKEFPIQNNSQISWRTRSFLIPFERREKGMIVQGIINEKEGYRVELLLDRAAPLTFIPMGMALQAGLDPEKGDPFPTLSKGIGVIVPLVELNSLRVGDAEVKNMTVAIHEVDGRGVLGMDFLSNFKIEIDDSQNQIILEPIKAARAFLH